jgi:hypothetical protein
LSFFCKKITTDYTDFADFFTTKTQKGTKNTKVFDADSFDECSPAYGLPPSNELLGQAGQAGQVTQIPPVSR